MKKLLFFLVVFMSILTIAHAQKSCDICSSLSGYTLKQSWSAYQGKDSIASKVAIYTYRQYRKMCVWYKDGTFACYCIEHKGKWEIVKITNTQIILCSGNKALFFELPTRTFLCPCIQKQKSLPSHDTRDD